jgi:glycogen debranching enzyme
MSSDTVSILEGDTFVVSDRRGDVIPSASEPHGLFLQDTRFLSCWRLTVDGSRPKLLSTDDAGGTVTPAAYHGAASVAPRARHKMLASGGIM